MTQQEQYWKELAESYLKTIKEINHQCGTANPSSFNQIKDAVASAIELSDEAMSNVPNPPATEHESVISYGKKCFYKGFEKAKKDDANCFTAWREEAPYIPIPSQPVHICCARWIKASERLPDYLGTVHWKDQEGLPISAGAAYHAINIGRPEIVYWLDQSAPAKQEEDSTSGFIGDKKIGSKWVIQDCINGHEFEIGTIVTIIAVDEEDYYATDGKKSWYVRDNELSHINGIK